LVSLLKGLETDHRLFILAGITTFGTQAAAEHVANPEYVKELATHLKVEANDIRKARYLYIDIWKDVVNFGCIETNVGGSRYHAAQRAKDIYLRLFNDLWFKSSEI